MTIINIIFVAYVFRLKITNAYDNNLVIKGKGTRDGPKDLDKHKQMTHVC